MGSAFALATFDDGLDTKIAPVVAEAQSFVISTREHIEMANERRRIIKELMGQVEAAFGEPKKSAYDTWKLLVAKEKEHLTPLQTAYDLIGKKMGAFVQAEEAARAAAQRKAEEEAQRQQDAELARIEKKTLALLEKAGGLDEQITALQAALESPDTADAEAASLRAQLATLNMKRDKNTAAMDVQAVRAQQAAVAQGIPAGTWPSPAKVAGMSTRMRKIAVVNDKALIIKAVADGRLPIDLLDVNFTTLNKLTTAGMAVPGVAVREEVIVATRR